METPCCAPLDTPLGEEDAQVAAEAFRALGDPVRLRLLSLIASAGEVCACELVEAVGRSQPTVSHHLKVLHDAGLLERERRGTWVWYRAVSGRLAALGELLRLGVDEGVSSPG